MNYTLEELQKLSDLEIDMEVAELLGEKGVRTFCSNHNDIMPIAFDNKIELVFENKWRAKKVVKGCLIYATNTNPLRAICEVFILMNQGAES